MSRINRREILGIGLASMAIPGATILNLGCTQDLGNGAGSAAGLPSDEPTVPNKNSGKGSAMKIQYLEIVTTEVDAACALYAQMHGVTFGDAEQNLGGARTAKLAGGGLLGIRAPLRPSEKPVVRPYILVDDIEASVAAAAKSGAEIAMGPTEIAGRGRFAIVIQCGIESGLWEV